MPQSHLAVSSDTAAVAAVSPIGSDAAASTNAQTTSASSKKKNKTSDHALAGSLAGMISKTVLQPLDLIKTRMQVQNADSAVHYRGVGHAIKSVHAEGGVRAFYQGFAPNLLGSAISWGVYFYTYNSVKRYFQTHPNALPFLPSTEAATNGNDGLTPVHHFLSGGVAGVVAVLISNPIWMIKTRIQLQSAGGQAKIYNGIGHALRTIVHEEGWRALYRGLAPALTLVSNGALQFMAYEHLRKMVVSRLPNHENDIGPQHFLALGAAAKVVSCTAVYPLQVVKSRLYQRATPGIADAVNSDAPNHRVGARYNSMRDVIRHVHQTDGIRGFYKGLVPQLMKVAPASAITFLSYETIVKFLRGKELYQDIERGAQQAIQQLSSLTKAQAQTPRPPEKTNKATEPGQTDPKRTL